MNLEVRNINKSFDQNHVLKNINFTVNSGQAFGLLGRNGSGKTTTIRIIMDLFPPDSGEVLINGDSNRKSISKIGYLPEERGLYPKRVIAEQMCYIGELRGMKASDARKRSKMLLEKIGAEEYYKKKLDTLSKGNQQKIQLAIALINDPDIVILDEPFSGLDPVNAKILKDLVTETVKEGKMVIFSSHQMSYVEEFCEDVCIINHGEIVLEGNIGKIKRSYPRNRLFIAPEVGHQQKLKDAFNNSAVLKGMSSNVVWEADGALITLKNEDDKWQVFNTLANESVGIDLFRVVEPSLEEIFIEKAGDLDESI